jgi:hypothetical protein
MHETRCPNCEAINRVDKYYLSKIPQCGNCHKKLPEPIRIKIERKVHRYRRSAGLAVVAALVLLLVQPWEPVVRPTIQIPAPAPVQISSVACSFLPQPAQGIFEDYDSSPHVAQFTVRTSAGSSYFVKLEEAVTRRPVMTFFINGGSKITERVPLGRFVVKYATGQSWCGDNDLFGDDTTTNTADDDLLFERHYTGDGYSTSGWTIELIQQRGGNLRTHRIPKNEF